MFVCPVAARALSVADGKPIGVPVKRALLLVVLAACGSDAAQTSSDAGPAGTAPNISDDAGAASGDAAIADGSTTPADAAPIPSGPSPSSLPVSFTRPDVGTPLTQAELDAATDDLIALLKGTRYFDVVDERVHGWPESDPAKGYWYGTWWSGVSVIKSGGHVTYQHSHDGADNNGLRTAPLLEGACFAQLMWGKSLTASLVQRMARGYSSWELAMQRSTGDTAKPMLARAHYPANVTSSDGGRTILIDYAADRPGVDGTSEYVHLPTNPTFGDIWIKNNRSKDDMGHVFRSIAQVQDCAPRLSPAAKADLAQMKDLYATWSRQVEADSWGIATLDKSAQVTMAPVTQTLAHYTLTGNIECPGVLMMRLLGDGNPGSFDCGNGISALEQLSSGSLSNGVKQILRTHHEAAVNIAFLTGQNAPGLALLQGLASRVEADLALVTQPSPPAGMNPSDVAALLVHSANAGVPLTSNEVRWLQARLHTARVAYLAAPATTYNVFDAATPDGTYPYEPGGDGFAFNDIGVLLGACTAPYRNPATRPLLDCTRLLAAF